MKTVGRMEEKKVLKRKKRYVRLGLLLLLSLLVLGLLATDYALRNMMALFDGGQLFSYGRENNIHYLEIMGHEFYIDHENIYGNFVTYIEWTKGKSVALFESIKALIGKMSG